MKRFKIASVGEHVDDCGFRAATAVAVDGTTFMLKVKVTSLLKVGSIVEAEEKENNPGTYDWAALDFHKPIRVIPNCRVQNILKIWGSDYRKEFGLDPMFEAEVVETVSVTRKYRVRAANAKEATALMLVGDTEEEDPPIREEVIDRTILAGVVQID